MQYIFSVFNIAELINEMEKVMSSLDNKRLSDVIWSAYLLLVSRDSDVATQDGVFATVDIGMIMDLEHKLVMLFETASDDITDKDAENIRRKLLELSK